MKRRAQHRAAAWLLASLLLCQAFAIEPGQYVGHPDSIFDAAGQGDDLPDEAVDVAAANAYGGGDADLESMLHWAISHSDPDILRKSAQDALQEEALASLKERRERVKQLLDVMNQQPSDAGLIKEAIDILTHPESDTEHQHKALSALQILVEPIDNANDLKVLGGLAPIMTALTSDNDTLRAAAAYVVGTAASNNPTFQDHITQSHPDVFDTLVKLIKAGEGEVVVKGLYAAASLVRNLAKLRQTFLDAGGLDAVGRVLQPPEAGPLHGDARAQRKALAMLIDLVHLDEQVASKCIDKGLHQFITPLMSHHDPDIQEKALEAAKTLMRYSDKGAKAFQDAGTAAHTSKLYKHLMDHLLEPASDLDDHYVKYILNLVQEVQAGLKKGSAEAQLGDKNEL